MLVNFQSDTMIQHPVWWLWDFYFTEEIKFGYTVIEIQNSLPKNVLDSLTKYASFHDDVIKWKHFPRHWPFVRGFTGARRPVTRRLVIWWRLAIWGVIAPIMTSLLCIHKVISTLQLSNSVRTLLKMRLLVTAGWCVTGSTSKVPSSAGCAVTLGMSIPPRLTPSRLVGPPRISSGRSESRWTTPRRIIRHVLVSRRDISCNDPDIDVAQRWPNVGTVFPTLGQRWLKLHCCLGRFI